MISVWFDQILRLITVLLILFIWSYGKEIPTSISSINTGDFLAGILFSEFSEITLVQADVTQSETMTNTVYFVSTNKEPTIWERYYSTTTTHPLRRADVLFFISIPFTILWTDFWVQRFRDFSVMGAYFEGVRGSYNLRNNNFTYYHDTYPSSVDDPYYVFKWVNAVLWPLIIVSNDFLERISDPVKWEKEKEEMIDNRFHLNLIYLPTH